MSISYIFYFTASLQPHELLTRIAADMQIELSLRRLPQAWEAGGIAGVSAAASTVRPAVIGYLQQDYGFIPRLSLTLRLDKRDLALAMAQVVEVLCTVRAGIPGDLLLLREHDSLAYRRQGTEEEIVSEDALWFEPARLARLKAC